MTIALFPWYRGVLVKFSMSTGGASCNALIRGEPRNSEPYKQLATSLYRISISLTAQRDSRV